MFGSLHPSPLITTIHTLTRTSNYVTDTRKGIIIMKLKDDEVVRMTIKRNIEWRGFSTTFNEVARHKDFETAYNMVNEVIDQKTKRWLRKVASQTK